MRSFISLSDYPGEAADEDDFEPMKPSKDFIPETEFSLKDSWASKEGSVRFVTLWLAHHQKRNLFGIPPADIPFSVPTSYAGAQLACLQGSMTHIRFSSIVDRVCDNYPIEKNFDLSRRKRWNIKVRNLYTVIHAAQTRKPKSRFCWYYTPSASEGD